MDDKPDSGLVPGWFVTFGDMMSLLLTFFIMLVSFSELKSEEQYQALLDGFQLQFGSDDGPRNLHSGQLRPRNATLAHWCSVRRLHDQAAPPQKSQVEARLVDREFPMTAEPDREDMPRNYPIFSWEPDRIR